MKTPKILRHNAKVLKAETIKDEYTFYYEDIRPAIRKVEDA